MHDTCKLTTQCYTTNTWPTLVASSAKICFLKGTVLTMSCTKWPLEKDHILGAVPKGMFLTFQSFSNTKLFIHWTML